VTSMATPRVVLVTRRTEYDELIARHGTRGQADFFLRSRGQSLDVLLARHHALDAARHAVLAAIPVQWRRGQAERDELARFVFGPDDIVVAIGQDGLVANVAKYLDGQPVIGVNPMGGGGALVPHPCAAVADLLADIAGGRAAYLDRAMVEARTDDGQQLRALNEIFVGHASHQSARYDLSVGATQESQSSSGVIAGTGTGASGWCASIQRAVAPDLPLPAPADRSLAWFVREAWPSASTGTALAYGILGRSEALCATARSEELVIFGDGIESDRLLLSWGQGVRISLSESVLRTVK